LALDAAGGDPSHVSKVDLAAVFRRFGFHSPQSFGNWPNDMAQPVFRHPVGQNIGFASRYFPPIAVTISNLGCPACHSGVMYQADGTPDPARVWLGMPNTSINLEAFTTAVFKALRDHGRDTDRMMDAVSRMYPETDWRERLTLRYFILPVVQKTIAARNAAIGRLLPFRSSLAGATNGLDSLKNRLGLIPDGTIVTESTFNSVPDLGGRLFRTKLLNTGGYTIPGIKHDVTVKAEGIDAARQRALAGIIAYFTVPSMGVSAEVAETSIEPAITVGTWLKEYRPQPFPGAVRRNLLPKGRFVYASACAACHGAYNADLDTPALVSFPNWEGEIGTDPARARLVGPDVVDAVNNSRFGRYIGARIVDGYTAPPLTGIWASAPYFHNGSVPTLWHLMHPQSRPAWFRVGGHKLDLVKVGIAGRHTENNGWDYPAGYVPWSDPVDVDTKAFGLDNGGHEKEFEGLTENEKEALLEYLKLL
jgi:hypothetical protein